MSGSVRPHRQQPTRLPRPWDSPGKHTGVGCHFLLQNRQRLWAFSLTCFQQMNQQQKQWCSAGLKLARPSSFPVIFKKWWEEQRPPSLPHTIQLSPNDAHCQDRGRKCISPTYPCMVSSALIQGALPLNNLLWSSSFRKKQRKDIFMALSRYLSTQVIFLRNCLDLHWLSLTSRRQNPAGIGLQNPAHRHKNVPELLCTHS